jgi:hypothetical protein
LVQLVSYERLHPLACARGQINHAMPAWQQLVQLPDTADAMKYLLAAAAMLALTSVSATGAERYRPNETIIVPPATLKGRRS